MEESLSIASCIYGIVLQHECNVFKRWSFKLDFYKAITFFSFNCYGLCLRLLFLTFIQKPFAGTEGSTSERCVGLPIPHM